MELGFEPRAFPTTGVVPLAADEAHIWLARLGRSNPNGATDFETLSTDEQERARSMADAPAKQFVAARALLRRLLAGYVPCPAARIEIAFGPHGKPHLAGTPSKANVQFNLSHSAGVAAVAIGSSPLGIDIERLRDLSDPDAIAARFFAPGEVRALRRVPDAQQQRTFFSFWTCKEAYLKALGGGLARGLASFEVEIDAHGEPALIRSDGSRHPGWTLKQVVLEANLVGAVAIQSPRCSVRCWRLDPLRGRSQIQSPSSSMKRVS